jgi:DMSO/TMAO reductase YedYZ molybdopterin-dependent catalytic subunit
MPDWKKLIAGKIALAKNSKGKAHKPSQPNVDARVPPGQKLVTNFPVLDLGIRPNMITTNWSFREFGLVENELNLKWSDFRSLPQIKDTSDFHCVTLHGYDGYTTNLPLEALLDDDVLVAHSVLGKSLTTEHGGPVRLVVPKRYAWKSAKWLKAIELHEFDRPGFWEERGYHNNAFPFEEQRFSDD